MLDEETDSEYVNKKKKKKISYSYLLISACVAEPETLVFYY